MLPVGLHLRFIPRCEEVNFALCLSTHFDMSDVDTV
jgi:hypothetical protein